MTESAPEPQDLATSLSAALADLGNVVTALQALPSSAVQQSQIDALTAQVASLTAQVQSLTDGDTAAVTAIEAAVAAINAIVAPAAS